MVKVPVLTDGTVRLRAHTEGDLVAFVEQNDDLLTRTWTRVPVPYRLEDAQRALRHVKPDGWALDQEWSFAVDAPDPGEPSGTLRYAGTVTLRNCDEARAEIAYAAHPWARGRGVIEAALRLLVEWGFAEHGLETIVWWAQEGNWASRKVAWRLGFSCDGVVRRWQEHRGALVDAWVGTLHRDDVRAPRGPWYDVPTIHGEGIRLRVHRDEDAVRIQEACADERSARWLGSLPSPYTLEDAQRFLRTRPEQMASGTAVHWIIADPVTDAALGAVSVMTIGGPSGPEVGYWTHPDARGRGVMTEAVRLVRRHAFVPVADGGLGLTKLRLVAAVDNHASRQVAVANGFREVGIERAGTRCRDGAHDAMIYDLLASDVR